MKYLWLVVLVGCADIRVPLAHIKEHAQEVKRDVRTCGSISTEDRVKVEYNLDRAVTWIDAAIEHKGMPPQRIVIPETPLDTRAEINENELLKKYNTEVQQEKAIRAVVSGWFSKTLGVGVGGTGLASIIGLLLRNLQKKRKALAEYDSAIESLPKKKRVELGEKRPAMTEAHESLEKT